MTTVLDAHARQVVLNVQDLSVRFGSLNVLREVSLTVRVEDTVGVIGPNGAGKSTLLAAIAGQLAPSNGSVMFLERDITAMRPATRASRPPSDVSGARAFRRNDRSGQSHGRSIRSDAARRHSVSIGVRRPPPGGPDDRRSRSRTLRIYGRPIALSSCTAIGVIRSSNDGSAEVSSSGRARCRTLR